MANNNVKNVNSCTDAFVFNSSKSKISSIADNNHNSHKYKPAIRISAIANMAFCERATYNISFFGMESDNFNADGVIGNAIHRITLRSLTEITQSLRNNSNTIKSSHFVTKKSQAKETFIRNAERDIRINWKHFMISNIENPLPSIIEDLEIRSDRLIDQIFAEEEKKILFRLI
jgi:hypothetical protein